MFKKIKDMLSDTELDIGDTAKIMQVNRFFQKAIAVIAVIVAIIAFCCLFALIGSSALLGFLTFLCIIAVDAVCFVFTKIMLNILFGFFYDIRTLRMLKETDMHKCEEATEE